MPAQNSSGTQTEKRKGGAHFQIEIRLKKSAWFRKHFPRSHLGDRTVRNARAPSRSVFSLFVLLRLGRISATSRVTSRWSDFFVQISEQFSRVAVTFCRSISVFFLEGCVYIFSGISRSANSSLGTPPKSMFLARCSGVEVHRECFLVSVSRESLSGNFQVLLQKDRHTHVLVTKRKGS